MSDERLAEIVSAAAYEGAAAAFDGELHCYRCDDRFSPASTFKVPNALIALDLGVAAGPEHSIEWDGERHEIEAWNRDHTLASALEHSVVWYYQAIAREVGMANYQNYMQRLPFGDGQLGAEVDQFWLDGSLTISPREQIAFWRALDGRQLPISPTAMEQVMTMTELASFERDDLTWKMAT